MHRRARTVLCLTTLTAVALLALDALAAPKSYKCDPGTAKVGVGCDCPKGMAPAIDDKGIARCVAVAAPPKKDSPPTPSLTPTAPPSGGLGAPTTCPTGMAGIPGGKYKLAERGDEAEVAPFCLDKTEVTVRAYEACVDGKGCTEPNAYASKVWDQFCNWKHPSARASHPVNCVDWDQATAYCAYVGGRLPSEEEWEWAARGGDKGSKYPWGDSAPSEERANACGTECPPNLKTKVGLDTKALFSGDDGFPETAPVGSFPKGDNRWGVHDLSGNVWEWTSSKFSSSSAERVSRGGSWRSVDATRLSGGSRDHDAPSFRHYGVGFRCARTP